MLFSSAFTCAEKPGGAVSRRRVGADRTWHTAYKRRDESGESTFSDDTHDSDTFEESCEKECVMPDKRAADPATLPTTSIGRPSIPALGE